MKKTFKKAFNIYLFFLIILTLFSISYALLVYFGKINSDMKRFNTTTFIIGVVCFFLLGFVSANIAKKNGLLEGLVSALIIILITLIVNLFVRVDFNFKTFVKCVTYLVASSLGGVIGVNIRPLYKRSLH
jgi:putative membrane protein (TIGR04086 family)